MTGAWCIIAEWEDGTVGVSGPYPDRDSARAALWTVALEVEGDGQADELTRVDEDHVRVRADSGDGGDDVYTQPMGTPPEALS